MAYETAIGIIMIGVNAIFAYLSANFDRKQIILQTFFTILTIAMIPLDLGVLQNVLVAQSVDSTITDAVGTAYSMSIWMVIVFVAILLIQILYTSIVKPLGKMNSPEPYRGFEKEVRMMK